MLREEISPEFKWDFTHIYASDKVWEEECAWCAEASEKLADLNGKLAVSAEALTAGLDSYFAVAERLEKAYIYAMLHRAADGGNAEWQQMNEKAGALFVKFEAVTSFMVPEILSVPEEKLRSYMADCVPEKYHHYLEDIMRSRKHTLDADKEKLLAQLGDAAGTPHNAFEMLTDVDMYFPEIKDEDGNMVRLSNGSFGKYRESADRRVREDAFNGFFNAYKNIINTTAALYSGQVKLDSFYANVRGFESCCEAALFENAVPTSVYDSLTEAIHKAFPAMRKYLELRRRVLGLEKIDLFDLYVPMVPDVDFSMPLEEGKKLVKKALEPLGEYYGSLLDRAFTENWMDVYENKGKRSGAFSCGVYGVHPYVLLNYKDTLDDAYTVAHELGHSMHSYFSAEAQEYCRHDYRIMVAEVASTVNEVLLTMYLLKTETDKKRRAYVMNNFLEGFRTTVFRQTLFAEFERKAHDAYAAGQPLTAESLSAIYGGLLEQYYAGAEINDIMRCEWSYIPHFYRNFYVFQYATGFCSAVAIAKDILESGSAEKYLSFLHTGGSDYPMEELKLAGIDLSTPASIESAMELFDKTVDELSALLEEC